MKHLETIRGYNRVIGLVARPRRPSLQHHPAAISDSQKHCILLHGWGATGHDMRYWAEALAATEAGQTIHFWLPTYDTAWRTFPQSARDIKVLLERTPFNFNRTLIIGYSMGGLVARAYLCKHGIQNVAKVITLGTPHHGTRLAIFGKGMNSAQMRRYGTALDGSPSEWLRRLADLEPRRHRGLFVSLFTHHDNIVAPQISSYLPGARNIAFHGVGHVALGTNRKVQDRLIEEILIFCLFLLMMRILRVAEPIVVNTVSNSTESCEKATCAEGSVSSLSFLQLTKATDKQILAKMIKMSFRMGPQRYA